MLRQACSPPLRNLNIPEILDAIGCELAASRRVAVFRIESQEFDRGIWKIRISGDQRTGVVLDESFEGQTAWWPGPPKGAADVLSVSPDELQINLRFATLPPPGQGHELYIYAPRYLEPLRDLWRDATWSSRSTQWVRDAVTNNVFTPARAVSTEGIPKPLRRAQRGAFDLPGWRVGFLWGPPGTGKTYTLGALLGAYLLRSSSARVLLLSSTNAALDQALVSVDEALRAYGGRAEPVRRQCRRVGNHFGGARYVGRDHLLPVRDPDSVRRLAELEAVRPAPEDAVVYATWKAEVERVRSQLRARARVVLSQARLAALTTTAAVFLQDSLRQQPTYDLVVFDEASQVGLAHALALAPLGRHVVFAGDPQQLEPIVHSDRDIAHRWLGASMFTAMRDEHPSTCFLNEQSRMVDPICAVVSGVFYNSRLVVAADCTENSDWLCFRRMGGGNRWSPPHLWLEDDLPSGTWSQRYGGPIRYSSTEWVIHHLPQLLQGVQEHQVVVLTPFRAQRALMRARLHASGYRGVRVSTIHRAQGSEEHTVIFDPVDGSSPFFEQIGRRLVNVALSRAQARLVLLFSSEDLGNAKLRQVAEVVRLARESGEGSIRRARSICELLRSSGWHRSAVGEWVAIGTAVGRIEDCDPYDIVLRDAASGEARRFKTAVVSRLCAEGRLRQS